MEAAPADLEPAVKAREEELPTERPSREIRDDRDRPRSDRGARRYDDRDSRDRDRDSRSERDRDRRYDRYDREDDRYEDRRYGYEDRIYIDNRRFSGDWDDRRAPVPAPPPEEDQIPEGKEADVLRSLAKALDRIDQLENANRQLTDINFELLETVNRQARARAPQAPPSFSAYNDMGAYGYGPGFGGGTGVRDRVSRRLPPPRRY